MAELSLVGLKVVREVARRGSFSAAAERLGYTQSAVSRQVALMEAATGRTLFERHARGVRLTDAGTIVVRRAEAVLSEVEAATHELADLPAGSSGRLRIGAFSTALAALVPRAIAACASRYPRANLVLREGSSDRLLAGVASGRLDLAVVTPPPARTRDVEFVTVLEDHLFVAVGRGDVLGARRSVTPDELRSARWVAGSTEPRSTLLGAWSESRWQPDIAYVARDWTAKLGLVAAGLAVTIVPGVALPMLPESIGAVRIDHPRATRTTALALPADRSRDGLRDAFEEALYDAAADLASETRRRVRG